MIKKIGTENKLMVEYVDVNEKGWGVGEKKGQRSKKWKRAVFFCVL